MLRFGFVLMAAALTAGAIGCAQCDTCDDFPTPCVGPNCGGSQGGGPPIGAYTTPTSAVVAPAGPMQPAPTPATIPAPAPAASSEPAGAPPAGTPPMPAPDSTPPAPMSPGGAFTPPRP